MTADWPLALKRRHAQQQIARVRNAGIAQQPFQVALRQRAKISVKDRQGGNDDEEIRPVRA